jgi:hypothetical protein
MPELQTTDWPAQAAMLQLARGMLIAGKIVQAATGASFPVIGPRDGLAVTSLPEADSGDLDHAVRAAREAFDSGVWRNVSRRSVRPFCNGWPNRRPPCSRPAIR